jgi:hypothetical protein
LHPLGLKIENVFKNKTYAKKERVTMKDIQTKEQFIEFRAKGYSLMKISKMLKVSKQTLIMWQKDFNWVISNIKNMQMETLYEKYFLDKEERIKLFGETIRSLNKALKKKNCSDLSSKEILEQLPKYIELLKSEHEPVNIMTDEELEMEKRKYKALVENFNSIGL